MYCGFITLWGCTFREFCPLSVSLQFDINGCKAKKKERWGKPRPHVHLWGYTEYSKWASLVVQRVKSLPAVQETWVPPLGWEDPLEKETQPTPVLLPGESHGHRSLAGYSPWGHKQSDTTERLTHTHHTLDALNREEPHNLLFIPVCSLFQ